MGVTWVIPDQAIWVIVAAFYLFDNFTFLAADEAIASERLSTWEWSITFPVRLGAVSTRLFAWTNPLTPFLLAVRGHWMDPVRLESRSLTATRRALMLTRRWRVPYQVLAVASFSAMFLLGPALTEARGLPTAFRFVLPLHLALLAVFAWTTYCDRRMLGIPVQTLVGMTAEMALCPGYLPNLLRRLSRHVLRLEADAAALALRGCDAAEGAALLTDIQLRLDDAVAEAGDDAARLAHLAAYRTALLLARECR